MVRDALTALLLAGIQPRKVARTFRDVPLRRAYLVHWLGLLAGIAVVFWMGTTATYAWIFEVLGFARERVASPYAGLTLLAILLGIEAAFLLVALLALPWTDPRTSIHRGWRHALRTVWLHTGQLVLVSVVTLDRKSVV